MLQVLDSRLFALINGLAGRSTALDRAMMLLVNEYFVPAVLALVLLGLWFSGRSPEEWEVNQRAVLNALMAVGLACLLVYVCNSFYYRARPFTQEAVNLLFYQPTDSSFPSNPTAVAFAVAISVYLLNHQVGIFTLVLSALYGFSRLYCGIHYPLDVLGGALVGTVPALLVFAAWRITRPVVYRVLWLGRKLHLA